jgi:hypothetical protein
LCPVSARVGAWAATPLVSAFSAAAVALACFFIVLKDVFETFGDDLVIDRAVRLAMLSPQKKANLCIASKRRVCSTRIR